MTSQSITRLYVTFLTFLLLFVGPIAHALVKMDINQGSAEPIPIAIGYLDGHSKDEKQFGTDIREVIINDLEGSGLFRSIAEDAFIDRPSFKKQPNFGNWRKINATILAIGIVEKDGDKLAVTVSIWDPYSEILIEKVMFKTTQRSWRRIGHKIADKIYNHLTGESGYFDSKVAFIAESGRNIRKIKKLAIMDQDGANVKYLTDGRELVLMPRFNQTSQQLAYLAFHNKAKQVKVYLLDLNTGLSTLVGRYRGLSFAPAFSPNGRYLAMSVAFGGTTRLYEIDLHNGNSRRLTNDLGAISTSPSYSPDNSKIVFNSDRGGSSQIYVMDRSGSNIKRISRGKGIYSTPVWSPRGDLIAFTKLANRKFYIGVMRPDGSGERLLTSSWLEEGPTWSPNGRVIMFYRGTPNGVNSLHSIDITGYHERKVPTPGSASDPAWSTLL